MTARLLPLTVMLAAPFTVAAGHARDEKPSAPPPRVAEKGKAPKGLLIGSWKFVSEDGRQPRKDNILTLEFTRDGKLVHRFFSPRRQPRQPEAGTYRLEGNTLSLSFPDRPQNYNPAGEYWGTIETLTEDKLILIGKWKLLEMPHTNTDQSRTVYSRVRRE